MSFLRFSAGECAEKRLARRLFGRFQRAQTASEGPVSSGESPETDRTEFEMKRDELRARKDRLLGRMEKLRRETDDKEAWEKYTQEFLQSYNTWDVAFDQIDRSHYASYQDSMQQLLLQYEKRMHERESTEGTKEERNIDASATPEIGMEKHVRKLTEAQKQPNRWKTLETGTPGYLYCFVPDKGFFAYLIEGKTFWKNEEGTARFTKIERPSSLPLLPEEEEVEKRKQEERKREEAEKKRKEEERRQLVEDELRKERERKNVEHAKNSRKLAEAQRRPDTWIPLAEGTPGFLYYYTSAVAAEGFYAWDIGSEQLQKYDNGVREWKNVPWKQGIRMPPGRETRSNPEEVKKRFGSALEVADVEHPVVQQNLDHLNRVPQVLVDRLRNNGVKIKVANADIVGMSNNAEEYILNAPRGWSRKDWRGVPGGYDWVRKIVYAGNGSHGSSSLALHEYGHAVGDCLGLDGSSSTIEAHKRLYGKLIGYLQQDGPGGNAGRQEFVAESLADLFLSSRAAFMQKYDEEWYNTLWRAISMNN